MRCGAAVLFLAGVLAAQPSRPDAKGTIRGVLKDTDGIPAIGLSVGATPAGAGLRFATAPDGMRVNIGIRPMSADTGEDGSYALTGLDPGTYAIGVARERTNGIGAERERITIASRQVRLDPGQDMTLDFVIPASPAIGGHVRNEKDEPVIDAFVWLVKPQYQAGVLRQAVIGPKVTGEDGAYEFADTLEPNRGYYVLVDWPPPEELAPAASADLKDREPIEVPTYYPSATRMDTATPMVLQPGERREQVDIKIATAPFYCVEGKMQIAGAPSSNFAIQEAPLAGTRLARLRSYTANDGTYHACGLSPGPYRLVTDAGFTEFAVSASDLQRVDLVMDKANLWLQLDWDGDPPPPPGTPKLDAAAEAVLRKLAGEMGMAAASQDDLRKLLTQPSMEAVMRLERSDPGFVGDWGRVTGQFGRPMDLVNVSLAGDNTASQPSLTVRIPFSGAFRNAIPAGDYAVEFQSDGRIDAYPKEISYNGLPVAGGLLRLAPGVAGTLRVLMAAGAATVTVRVTDADGESVQDATVMVIPDSVTDMRALSRVLTRGQTDQTGSCTLRSLAPGKYRVLATREPVHWEVPEDLRRMLLVLVQAKEVELGSRDNLQVTVGLVEK